MKPQKGLITRNTHVKYQKGKKLQCQGHRVKKNGTHGKVLSQGILM